jgi:NAD(P)H-dependent flavin oxidoreductase YrpB (nitropropane dioxygenase family)
MLKTRICELFGFEHPIISAGMGGVALAELAAAVSEAGGLGTIGLAALIPEIRDAVGEMPVVAAGGIADGRDSPLCLRSRSSVHALLLRMRPRHIRSTSSGL